MKLIHLITILFLIGLLITVASMFGSAESMNTFFTYLSWVEFVVFSFLITFAFRHSCLWRSVDVGRNWCLLVIVAENDFGRLWF